LIARLNAEFSVSFLCEQLGVSRSGYYDTFSAPSARARRRTDLIVNVIDAFAESERVDGYRKVTAALHRNGIAVNRKTVAKLMNELGLVGTVAQAQFKRVKQRAARRPDPTDLLERDFSSTEPGSVLVGDITYVHTREGWLYVATVIDLASRAVLGCATGHRQSARLVNRALRLAHSTGLVKAGAIFHSDHGTQYRSKSFTRLCGKLGVRRSMGAKFECWDNAVAESFFRQTEERTPQRDHLHQPESRSRRGRQLHRAFQHQTAPPKPRLPHPSRTPCPVPICGMMKRRTTIR
jgi:putative transposase